MNKTTFCKKQNRKVDNVMQELKCIYDKRKSFGHKAMVDVSGDEKILYSYGLKVCTITKDNEAIYHDGAFGSQTTTRHINEFLKQNGIEFKNQKTQ